MYLIEITLKANPIALVVQRKDLEAADQLYKSILETLKTGHPKILELTCERQPEKKVAVLTAEITGIQISEKSSANSNLGLRAGFTASNS